MKKLSFALTSLVGVVGLGMMSVALWNSLTNSNFWSNLAFITQSATYKPSWIEGRWWKWTELLMCWNWVIEQWEQCETYNGSGSLGTWGVWMLSCDPWQQCVNCHCVNLRWDSPSSAWMSQSGSLESLSCETQYIAYSWPSGKLLIRIQVYNNWLPIDLPVWYWFASSVKVSRVNNYPPYSFDVNIAANGEGVKNNVSVWAYITSNAYITNLDKENIDCSAIKFNIFKEPEQYCGDGIQQLSNAEQCDYAFTWVQCEWQWSCNNECKCDFKNGSGSSGSDAWVWNPNLKINYNTWSTWSDYKCSILDPKIYPVNDVRFWIRTYPYDIPQQWISLSCVVFNPLTNWSIFGLPIQQWDWSKSSFFSFPTLWEYVITCSIYETFLADSPALAWCRTSITIQ